MKKVIQPVAALMIGLTFFGSLSQLSTARAAEPRSAQLTYNFSFDIPNHGIIDLYHNAYTSRDRVSNSLYVLRNTAIEDLLNTRRSIKILLGGTEGARKASEKKDISFDVPGGLVDLYLLGNLGGQTTHSFARSQSSSPLPGPIMARHGVDTDSIPEISYAIHWLSANEPKYDEALRSRLLTGLVYVSAQLTKYDQQLKFIQKDFFNHSTIRQEFYEAEIKDWEMSVAQTNGPSNPELMREYATGAWLKKHEMTGPLAVLAGHRAYLLDRYKLLENEIDGKPLYKIIYEKMESVGFPRADLVQEPVEPHLPKGNEPIQIPSSFEQAVNVAFDRLLGSQQNQMLSELGLGVNSKINQALITILEANTQHLADLSNIIDFSGDRSSPLLELARYEDLWTTATEKYAYLSSVIDFKGAHDEITSYIDRVDTTKKRVRYTLYGAGIGIGVAATIFSGGTVAEAGGAAVEGAGAASAAATWLGIPLRAWLIGSGLITSAQSTMDYVDSDAAAQVAQGLYLGTTHLGSHQSMVDAVTMRDSDFKMLICSLVLLGAEAKVINLLAASRPILQAGGKTLVRLSTEELTVIKNSVTALAGRAEKLAPMGRALLGVVRQLLGLVIETDRMISIEEAIPMIAQELRMTPKMVMARLEANSVVGSLIKGMRLRNEVARIMGRPSFFKTLAVQQATSAMVSVATEVGARGKHIYTDELSDFANDFAQNLLITFALVYIGAPTAVAEEATAANNATAMSGKVKIQSGFFNNTGAGRLIKQGGQNFLVGVTVNGATTAVAESIQYLNDNGKPNASTVGDHAMKVGKNSLYGGLYMGISSNLRYAAYSWIENNISKVISNNAAAKIIVTSANIGNNLFGGWGYVHFGKALGFLEDGAPAAADDGAHELNSRINGIQMEDLGGGYLRIEGDSSDAGYMFDFLQGSAQPTEQPEIAK